MHNNLETANVIKNILWKLLERSASFVITLLIGIILARMLSPSDFGLASMMMVFVNLSMIVVTGGPSNALVQKKNIDEADYSSMFWMNMAIAISIYILLFFLAPFISLFYGYPQLNLMLRVLSINIIIAAINSIQGAYIARNLMFRHYFVSTILGKIASGFVGIGLAFLGEGVWSLIGQSVSLLLFETIILWFKVKRRPLPVLEINRIKALASFSWKIMLMNMIENIGDQFRKLLIAKRYNSESLAYFDKGQLFPANIITNIASSLSAVLFPVLSRRQDNQEKALFLCRRWTAFFTYITFPLFVWMIITARTIIVLLLTVKWLSSTSYMQLASLAFLSWVIEIPVRETLKSLGFANVCLKMQVIKTLLALSVLVLIISSGVQAVAYSIVFCSITNVLISIYYGRKYFGYQFYMLSQDLLPTVIMSTLMGLCVYIVELLEFSLLLTFLIQIIVGCITYISMSCFSKNSNYIAFRNLFNRLIHNR